jgi:hypothetical protein
MKELNWCKKCRSHNEQRLACLVSGALCEWCDRKQTPPSMFNGRKHFKPSDKHKNLVVRIRCDACNTQEHILLSTLPTFGNGYFIDISVIESLMCSRCFSKPSTMIVELKEKK